MLQQLYQRNFAESWMVRALPFEVISPNVPLQQLVFGSPGNGWFSASNASVRHWNFRFSQISNSLKAARSRLVFCGPFKSLRRSLPNTLVVGTE